MNALHMALALLSLPLVAAGLYLAVLAVACALAKPLATAAPRVRFTFLVPAHNEEQVLARTLHSLTHVSWPRHLFQVRVVADNCTDATASIARAAGVEVTERTDADHRGKGYALEAGVAACFQEPFCEALVVVDADSHVDANFLEVMQAHLDAGAQVIQARYGVLNPGDGWRARLMVQALALFHDVRSRGRSTLGLSAGLRGNGMCFTRAVLERVPLQATSLVEDVEQGIEMGLLGVVVHHAMETRVLGEMPVHGAPAATQRVRWEHGRAQLRKKWLLPLLQRAWKQKSGVLLDLALDLALPPLSSLAVVSVLGFGAALGLTALDGPHAAVALWGLAVGLLGIYGVAGMLASGRGWWSLVDLAAAPLFVAWKLALIMQRKSKAPPAWVRTARLGEKP